MLPELISKNQLSWLVRLEPGVKRIAILIPQYNELSNGNFNKRLKYFNELARKYSKILDLIIIDDGSTDNSLGVIKEFIKSGSISFNVAKVTPNANKIGALYLTVLNIRYDYILFSDFDTDLVNLEQLAFTIRRLDENPNIMGCYFRMIPVDCQSIVVKYQRLEYAISRIWYKYISPDRSVPVMPGAGSLYKRDILLQLLGNHSGLRNGEDRETTVIGLKFGYEVFYERSIFAMTRTPDTIKKLISQRARWDLGYLETFNKEKELYLKQAISFKRLGIRSFFDLLNNTLLLVFPFFLVVLIFLNLKIALVITATCYLLKIFWLWLMIHKQKNEIAEIKHYQKVLVLYPLLKVITELPAWVSAILKFLTSDYHKSNPQILNRETSLRKRTKHTRTQESGHLNINSHPTISKTVKRGGL